MSTLVTGASGFIGSHLVEALAAAGRSVIAAGRGTAPKGLPASVQWLRVDWERPDLGLPAGTLRQCEVVFHAAGVTRALDARGFVRGNVAPTRALIDLLSREAPGARIVYVSSQAAAGPALSADTPVTEAMPPAPIEHYGRSKLEAERLIAAAAHGLEWTIVRPTSVYGPRDRDFLSVFRMARFGVGLHALDPDSWISLIHVRDLTTAIIAASGPRAAGRTYFLGAHDALRWRDIYEAAGRAVGRAHLHHVAVPRPLLEIGAAAGEVWSRVAGRVALLNRSKLELTKPQFWIASSDRARRELGFAPVVALDEGMRETAAWYSSAKLL